MQNPRTRWVLLFVLVDVDGIMINRSVGVSSPKAKHSEVNYGKSCANAVGGLWL